MIDQENMTDAQRDEAYLKSKRDAIARYLDTGDIGTFISRDALGAVHAAKSGWKNHRLDLTKLEQENFDVYVEVNAAVQAIETKGKEFEFRVWMGFCEEDVQALLRLKRQWDHLDWPTAEAAYKDHLRSVWNPLRDTERHPMWEEFFARRDRIPLQETFDGYSLGVETETMKVMMASSAGRALLTVQDRYPQKHEKSVFGGAHATLIFDESNKYPRGGLQGQCCTRDEGVALFQALIDDMPEMARDSKVSFGF